MEMGITCQKLSNIKVYFAIPVSWHPSVPIYQHSLIALDPLLPPFKMKDARNGKEFYVQFQPNSILLLSLCAAWQAFPDPVISLNMNLIDERKGRQPEVNRNLSSKAQKRHPPNFNACSTAGETYLAGDIGRPSYSWVKRPSWCHTVDFPV